MLTNSYGEARTGALNRRVTILSYPEKDDGQGGRYVDKKNPVKTEVWAYVAKPHFTEGNSGGGPASQITQGFIIRKRSVGLSDVVRYQGTTYKILHIDYSGVRNLTLTCQAVMHNG